MDENNDPSFQVLESTRFWIQRVFVPILVCIGVGGNTVTVMVLTRKRMRSSTNIYLTALAVADIIYLLFVFFLSFSTYKHMNDRKYELYWKFFGITHWLCDAASSTSVWLTVSFTVERYIAVCHPIKGKVLCTENRAKSIVVIIAIFCLLTTASTTFEYELSSDEYCIRNCTTEELIKKIQQNSSGNNSVQNTTNHYFPDHHSILVTDFPNQETDPRHAELINKINTDIKVKLDKLLPLNCTSHHHIIYVPLDDPKLYNHNGTFIALPANIKNKSTHQMDKISESQVQNITSVDKFEFENTTGTDACCEKKLTITAGGTNLSNNDTYQTIIAWYSAIFFALLPLVLIAVFNSFLVHAVYKSQYTRRRMTNAQENVSLSNENRITIMLIGVIFLFLFCQTPTAIYLIYNRFLTLEETKENKNLLSTLGNIFNLLVATNAACNFVLYCVLSKKYRATVKSLFCERRINRQDTLLLSSNSNSQRFNAYKNGLRRNISEYRTPRNLETQSLTSIPRSKSLMMRLPGKAKSTDLNV